MGCGLDDTGMTQAERRGLDVANWTANLQLRHELNSARRLTALYKELAATLDGVRWHYCSESAQDRNSCVRLLSLSFRLRISDLHLYFSIIHPYDSQKEYNCTETAERSQIDSNFRINEDLDHELVHIGVILDLESRDGMIINSCISMAISDFYNLHDNYSTRLVLHTRDSKGESSQAVIHAIDLLDKNVKVEAIIGGQTRMEAKVLAELGDKAKVPLISLTDLGSFTPSKEHPFFVQISQDETLQYKGISSILQAFKWRDVIVISENSDLATDTLHMIDHLEENNISITRKIVVAASYTNEKIVEQLHKLMTFQTTVFIVHISSNDLVSRLLVNAKKLGMMKEEYAWFMTTTTLNLLHNVDIELMEGLVGLKPYIPQSKDLQHLTSRLRRKFYIENPEMELVESNANSIWAYDSIWALAEAAERTRFKLKFQKHCCTFLNELLQIRFMGLSGEIEFINRKLHSTYTFEIVNVIGKAERRVGFWNHEKENRKEEYKGRELLSSPNDLETIIWPGGSTNIPKGRSMRRIELRVGVPVKKGFRELVRVDRDPHSNATNVTGFCVDVFKAVVSNIPYVEYKFFPFENATGRYNEYVDQIYLQNYDVLVGDTTITTNRSNYADFTLPFTDLGVGMVVKKEKENTWIFLKPFSVDLWITTSCFFIWTGLVVWIIERPINQEFQGSTSQQIGTIFWFSFSTLAFAHGEKLLHNLSKFVVIVWLFVVLILTSSYTATLTSMMTVEQIELHTKGHYVGYQMNLFSLSDVNNNDLIHFKGGKPYNSPQEFADALSKGSKNGGVSAIIAELPYVKIFLAKYSDDYSMVKSMPSTNGFGFVFPKGSSPLVEDMSREIAKLRQNGELSRLEELWLNSKSTSTSKDPVNDPNALNVRRFRGLFFISGASSAFALVLFLVFSLKEKWHVVKKYFTTECLGAIRKRFVLKIFHVNGETEILPSSSNVNYIA